MALETTFQTLGLRAHNLREALNQARVTIVEDKPHYGETALVQLLEDEVEDLLGWLDEARAAAADAHAAVKAPANLERAREALSVCHSRSNRVVQRYYASVMSYHRFDQLVTLGNERGGEWNAWGGATRQGLERCAPRLHELNEALFRCWVELAERIGMNSIHIQTSSVGQQIYTNAEKEQGTGQNW